MTNKKYVISIVGTTAIGKTTLGIKLAKYFNTEIISADSRQFFKEMEIGTAVPSKEELQMAKHHFIQNLSVFDTYSVGDFEKDALEKIEELHKSHDVVILLGGSGLYIDAVLKGLDYFPKIDSEIRKKLKIILKNEGINVLQEKLNSLDPASYNKIEISNPQRLIRALEVCIGTNKTYSSFLNKKLGNRNFTAIKIGLTAEREKIYDRINQRVDTMIKNGLIQEAKNLLPNKNLNALQTVGYRELFNYFDGEFTLDFAISEIKKNTRRFAKRQVTWFKRDTETKWFDFLCEINNITEYLNTKIQK